MKRLGFAMCGSFCTHSCSLDIMEKLALEYEIVPILSPSASSTDTRFGSASELLSRIAKITPHAPIATVAEAEKLAAEPLDIMLICPCTGNTAAKLARGITDTAVTMAAKAHLRNDRPIVTALASNDALSANLSNIGALMQRKSFYFVPMRQDDVVKKPHSLVFDREKCAEALSLAESGVQMRPVFL